MADAADKSCAGGTDDLEGGQAPNGRGADSCNKISRTQAVAQMLNLYVGTGVLGIPQAIAIGGWLSLACFPLLGAAAWLTGQQIARGFMATGSDNYAELGFSAAGSFGKSTVVVIITAQFAVQTSYFLFLANDLLRTVIIECGGGMDRWAGWLSTASLSIIFMIAAQIQPSFMLLLGKVGTAITCAVVLSLVSCFLCLIYTGIDVSDYDEKPSHSLLTSNFLLTFASVPWDFCGHGFLPMIWREMRTPERDFGKAFGLSMIVMVVTYTIVGALGYAALGSTAVNAPDVLLLLPEQLPSAKGFLFVLMIMQAVKLCLLATFQLKGVFELIEPRMISWAVPKLGWEERHDLTRRGALVVQVSFFLAATAIVALAMDDTAREIMMDLTGVVGYMPETYLFPAIFFLLIARQQAVVPTSTSPSTITTPTHTQVFNDQEALRLIKTAAGWTAWTLFCLALIALAVAESQRVIRTLFGH